MKQSYTANASKLDVLFFIFILFLIFPVKAWILRLLRAQDDGIGQ